MSKTYRANVAISEDVLAVLSEGAYHIDLTYLPDEQLQIKVAESLQDESPQ